MSWRRKAALWLCPELEQTAILAEQGIPEKTPEQAMNKEMLISLAKTYAAHCGLALATVSTYAANDGKYFRNLQKEGSRLTLRKAERLHHWFARNWPDDLEWPADVPRPPKSTEAA